MVEPSGIYLYYTKSLGRERSQCSVDARRSVCRPLSLFPVLLILLDYLIYEENQFMKAPDDQGLGFWAFSFHFLLLPHCDGPLAALS